MNLRLFQTQNSRSETMVGPSRAEIWRADFSGSRGHEQKKERPCIIWRDLDHLSMAIVIPFTGSVEWNNATHTHFVEPTSSNGLGKESVALIFQIAAIDKSRLIKNLGVLSEEEIKPMGAVLKDMLRL